jgi:hypothetical protein
LCSGKQKTGGREATGFLFSKGKATFCEQKAAKNFDNLGCGGFNATGSE